LKDVVKMLGWQVPLEVDAEYGDNFHVHQDFWKEFNDGKFNTKVEQAPVEVAPVASSAVATEVSPATQTSEVPLITQEVSAPPKVPDTISQDQIEMQTVVSPPGAPEGSCNDTMGIYFKSTIRDAVIQSSENKKEVKKAIETMEQESTEIDPALQNIQIKDMIDKRGVLVYPMENLDPITSEQLKTVLKILIQYGNMFSGPKCKICITTKEGEVWYESSKKLSVDAFLALCTWLKI